MKKAKSKPRPLGAKQSPSPKLKIILAGTAKKTESIPVRHPFKGTRTRMSASSKKPISAVRKASNNAFSQAMAVGKLEQIAKKEAAKPSVIASANVHAQADYKVLVEQIRCSNLDLSLFSPLEQIVAEVKRLQMAAMKGEIKEIREPVFTHLPAKGGIVYLKPNRELEHLQKLVGGYIESIRVRGMQAWVNEDGRMMKLPLNHEATRLMNGYPIYGDMVVEGRV